MAQSSEIKLLKRFDQDVEITGNLTLGGNAIGINTDNFYLDGITKSGNTLTFSVNGATNQSYTFGSAAFANTTAFAAASHSHSYLPLSGGTVTGTVTINGSNGLSRLRIEGTTPTIDLDDSDGDSFYIHVNSNNFYVLNDRDGGGNYGDWEAPYALQLEADTNVGYVFGNVIIHSGNIGSQSVNYANSAGNADTVDGIQGSQIWKKGADIGGSQNLNNYTTDGYYHQNSNANASSGSNYPVAQAGMLEVLSDGVMVYQRYTVYNTADLYVRSYYNGTWYSWGKQFDSSNDGSGSGLDADLLDGVQASQFLRSDANDTASGVITFSTAPRITARNIDSGGSATYFGAGTRLNEYMSNVGLELHSGNDEPITIYFKSGVNAPSDCAYITYDPDYGNTGENGALVLGSENDGTGSADHIRLQARTIVDSDYHSSDNTEIMEWLQTGTQYAVLNTDYFRHNSDVRSPIFYDSNDTNYYLNANGTSRINQINYTRIESPSSSNAARFQNHSSWGTLHQTNDGYIQFGPANTGHAHIYTDRSNFYFNKLLQVNGVSTINTNDIRTKIYYDWDDTNYYVDPNGSNVSIKVAGEISNSNYAVGSLQAGALNIGRIDTNYSGIQSWSSDVRFGIMANCLDEWEFGIHDSGSAVESVFLYQNSNGSITMGRDVGWGTTPIIAANSFRSPVFYDSNNTTYYLDPASTGRAGYLRGYLEIINEVPTLQLNDYTATNTTNLNAWVSYQRNGTEVGYVGYGSGATNYLYVHNSDGRILLSGSLTEAYNQVHSPIYYDSNDTTYRVDPNGVSYMNQIDGPYFRNIQVPQSGLGSSYDERVILLIPKVETNSSYNNRIHGKLTMGKTGGNVIDFFDIEAQSVWNNTTVSFTSKGQRTGHKLVTCTYNGIKWVAIKFNYTANPYNFAWFHGEAITNFSSQAQTDMLKVISYADLSSGTTVLNSEIYNSIADYTPSPLHRKISFGKGTYHVEAEKFAIGGTGMTPQLELMFNDHGSGAGWDTAIYIGKSDELPEGTGFPAYVPTGSYGTMIKANSDGVFFGMEEYSSGNYRPIIQWGDDNTDSPFRIKHENGSEFEVTYDGHATATSSLRSPVYYDSAATTRFVDPAATGTSIRVSGDIVAYYSDERLKDIEGNIPDALEKVKSLNGFYYTPNEKAQKLGYKKKREVGLSAQEVEAILPELIKEAPISSEYKTVDYAKLVPLLVEAIKEQQKQIDELKKLINL